MEVLFDFQHTKDFDELWLVLKRALSKYEIESAIYAIGYSSEAISQLGLEKSSWYHCDHPVDYRDYFGDDFQINDDVTAEHCLIGTTPLVWRDSYAEYEMNKRQIDFQEESKSIGMAVGVTLPLRFGQHGLGGVGLNAACNEKEFDKIWGERSEEILRITSYFDEFARSKHLESQYYLSNREKEVLKWLAIGLKTHEIAEKIGNAVSTVEKQIRSARSKLRARTNEQAVAKALVMCLIEV